MLKTRVIPVLLLQNKKLVKSIKFKDYTYLGDPINAVKIFSEKEAHELVFFDINASKQNKTISIDTVKKIADECYMPFSVGGGIKTIQDIHKILYNGAEKVVINTTSVKKPDLIKEASEVFGSQSIIVCIDVKRKFTGSYEVYINGGNTKTGLTPLDHAKKMEELGAGEIMINSIDRDGTMRGYDIEIIKKIADSVNIPVIACGGAGKLQDFSEVVYQGHASAVSAGSLFVFYGPKKAVLINFPTIEELEKVIDIKG